MLSLLLERVLPVTVGIHNSRYTEVFLCLLYWNLTMSDFRITHSPERSRRSHKSVFPFRKRVCLSGWTSGCGKSTVLNLIAGLLIPEQGQITMQGLPREHSVLSVGYMLQKDHLFEWLTIYENVLLGLKNSKKKKQKNLFHTLTVSYRSMGSGTFVFPTLPSFPAGCDNGPH